MFPTASKKAREKVEDAISRDVDRVGRKIIENKYAMTLASKIRYSRVGQFLVNRSYRLYTWNLLRTVKADKVPRHIAIIMDGNRRFAKKLGADAVVGHLLGKERIEEVIEWCDEVGVKMLTIYAFSLENFNRAPQEVSKLMKLFSEVFKDVADDERINRNKIKIQVIGKMDVLPQDVRESIEYAINKTKDYDGFSLIVALAYGGREEIVQAIRDIAKDVKAKKMTIDSIDEECISKYLYTKDMPDPDLILRTSGEERISNFLLWQLAYSELSFIDVSWPEFRKIDFLRAIRDYQRRERRFGG